MTAQMTIAVLLCATISASPALASQRTPPVSRQPAVPIGVYVFTAKPVGLVPFDQKNREWIVEQLQRKLKGELPKKIAVPTTSPEGAEVMVEVMGTKADGDDYVVHLRVSVGEETFNVDGTNDDAHWSDVVGDAAKKIAEWVQINKDSIEARRTR